MHVLEQVEQVRVAMEAFAGPPAAEPPMFLEVLGAVQELVALEDRQEEDRQGPSAVE